jgi:predicted double-glycine peptidase
MAAVVGTGGWPLMLGLLLGALGVLIGLSGLTEAVEPAAQPRQQVALALSLTGAGVAMTEPVLLTPQAEFKFRRIVRQAYDYSCGSAALVTILNFHIGLAVSEGDAMEGMLDKGERDKIVARRGFSLLDMKRYVNAIDLDGEGFRATLDELQGLAVPAIVPIDYGGFKHFVVFRGLRDGRVFLADPSAGHLVLRTDEFLRLWDRNTLFIVSPRRGRTPVAQLALSDQELGVMDMDRLRDNARIDPNAALQRALDSRLGTAFYR